MFSRFLKTSGKGGAVLIVRGAGAERAERAEGGTSPLVIAERVTLDVAVEVEEAALDGSGAACGLEIGGNSTAVATVWRRGRVSVGSNYYNSYGIELNSMAPH